MTRPRIQAVLRTVVSLSADNGTTWTTVSETDRRVALEGVDTDTHLAAPRARKSAALMPSVRDEKGGDHGQ